MNISTKGLEEVFSYQLHTGLTQIDVNLNEDDLLLDKKTMMQKMSLVMRLENCSDPDPSYILTIDNMIKILAIQMMSR